MALMKLGARLTSGMSYVGFSKGAKLVGGVFRSKRPVMVRFAGDCLFEFPYADGYWGQLLDNRTTYGPEIEELLKRWKNTPYAFIDCGANFGYMSVMVTSSAFGNQKAVAIEADRNNFEQLSRNAALNGNRFECRHNAIYSQSGKELDLYGAKHEAFSLEEGEGGVSRGKVTTLALDDLISWLDTNAKGRPVILKLDVEGVEIDAMKGAVELAKRDCLVIYEEHGNDPTHEISRFMADELGLRLFHTENAGYVPQEFADFDEMTRLKRNSRVGYDFLATKSPFWLEQLGVKQAAA